MTLRDVTDKITEKMRQAPHIKARIKFDFGQEGLILVDTKSAPPSITHEERDAETTFITSLAVFSAILEGRQDPNLAFMTGKLKIKGSMGLAMKLNAVLED